MARFDVHEILSGRFMADGRINYIIMGELDDSGVVTQIPYTWDPAEVTSEMPWPMAVNIAAKFEEAPFDPEPYVWQPPDQTELEYRLKFTLNRLRRSDGREVRLKDYVERYISTAGAEPIPQELVDAAAFARATYNRFLADPASIPQDWEADRFWCPST